MQTSPSAGRHPLVFWDVDTQIDFVRPDGKLYVPEADSLLERLGRLTDAARRHGLPWIASADDHLPDDAELSETPDFRDTFPPHCMRGTPGADKVPETARPDATVIGHEPLASDEIQARIEAQDPPSLLILKRRFDVFSNPNAEALVRALEPGLVVVYGVALDVCNRFAVEGLLARGVGGVAVVTDATKAIRPEEGEALLKEWSGRGVELVTTDEIIGALDRDSELAGE